MSLRLITQATAKFMNFIPWGRNNGSESVAASVVPGLTTSKNNASTPRYQELLCTVQYSINAVREFRAGRCLRKEPWTRLGFMLTIVRSTTIMYIEGQLSDIQMQSVVIIIININHKGN